MLLRCETFRDAKLNSSQLQYSRKASKKKTRSQIRNSRLDSRLYSQTWNRKQIMSRFLCFLWSSRWLIDTFYTKKVYSQGHELKQGRRNPLPPKHEINMRLRNVKHEFICHLSENLCSFHNFSLTPSFLLLFRISLWRFLIELHTLNFYFIYWLCRT